jgi:hypothetical protein
MDDLINRYFNNNNAPGHKIIKQNKFQESQSYDLIYGGRAKSVLDKQLTSQNYHKTKIIQTPLLEHYENIDWWERDSQYDLDKYINK